ncbi:hypothetical protein KI387_026265, partial [Taxus chinensis]
VQGSSLGDAGMDINLLSQQLIGLVTSMFEEGFLDEQFTQLQMLQDARNPGFVADVISLFAEDSEKLLTELTKTLEQDPADFKKVDAYVHQLKGSSSSIGALRVKAACMDFRVFCEGRNREGHNPSLNQALGKRDDKAMSPKLFLRKHFLTEALFLSSSLLMPKPIPYFCNSQVYPSTHVPPIKSHNKNVFNALLKISNMVKNFRETIEIKGVHNPVLETTLSKLTQITLEEHERIGTIQTCVERPNKIVSRQDKRLDAINAVMLNKNAN